MNVVQHKPAPSSPPVIQGEHSWIALATAMSSSLPKKLQQVEVSVQKELRKRLLEELVSNSSWASLAKQVVLTVQDGTISIEGLSTAVSDLEYGTPEVPMNSKLRPFLKTANEYLKNEIDKALGEYS